MPYKDFEAVPLVDFQQAPEQPHLRLNQAQHENEKIFLSPPKLVLPHYARTKYSQKGHIFIPTYSMTINDYAKYNFVEDAEILYCLDLIKQGKTLQKQQ
ncbi:hypothetical protein [Porphyromonas macacae]|uniref:hypothetical protein n=1 Tax=Porphyromonas macacae TaxID=28115 RepID=UPI00046AB693|nr:hypothetical protein [Porphyromonas macacae]